MGKSRAEYMRDYRQRRRLEDLKNETNEKLKQNARNSTQRSRDFRARAANSIVSQTSTALPHLVVSHVTSRLPSLPSSMSDVTHHMGLLGVSGHELKPEQMDIFIRYISQTLLGTAKDNKNVFLKESQQWALDWTQRETLWKNLRTQTESSMQKLLENGDCPECNLSDTLWQCFDYYMVHNMPLYQKLFGSYGDNPIQMKAMIHLYNLVGKHRVEYLRDAPVEVRIKCWINVGLDYMKKGHVCSLMHLQRRWHEMKMCARMYFLEYWSVFRRIRENKVGQETLHRPNYLHINIAVQYPHVMLKELQSWTRSRKYGGFITMEQFENDEAYKQMKETFKAIRKTVISSKDVVKGRQNTMAVDASNSGTNSSIIRSRALTSTERSKLHYQRQKQLKQNSSLSSIQHNVSESHNLRTNGDTMVMSRENAKVAERMRLYRQRLREKKRANESNNAAGSPALRQRALTGAERSKLWYKRKKLREMNLLHPSQQSSESRNSESIIQNNDLGNTENTAAKKTQGRTSLLKMAPQSKLIVIPISKTSDENKNGEDDDVVMIDDDLPIKPCDDLRGIVIENIISSGDKTIKLNKREGKAMTENENKNYVSVVSVVKSEEQDQITIKNYGPDDMIDEKNENNNKNNVVNVIQNNPISAETVVKWEEHDEITIEYDGPEDMIDEKNDNNNKNTVVNVIQNNPISAETVVKSEEQDEITIEYDGAEDMIEEKNDNNNKNTVVNVIQNNPISAETVVKSEEQDEITIENDGPQDKNIEENFTQPEEIYDGPTVSSVSPPSVAIKREPEEVNDLQAKRMKLSDKYDNETDENRDTLEEPVEYDADFLKSWEREHNKLASDGEAGENKIYDDNCSVPKMGKTNAESCKDYYYRKKAAKEAEKKRLRLSVEKPIRKTGAERIRAYRLQKKMLAHLNQSSVTEILPVPPTSRTSEASFQLATNSASTNQPDVAMAYRSDVAEHECENAEDVERIDDDIEIIEQKRETIVIDDEIESCKWNYITKMEKITKKVYGPLAVYKNPDFNQSLQRFTASFMLIPRNRSLLNQCKPCTIDLVNYQAIPGPRNIIPETDNVRPSGSGMINNLLQEVTVKQEKISPENNYISELGKSVMHLRQSKFGRLYLMTVTYPAAKRIIDRIPKLAPKPLPKITPKPSQQIVPKPSQQIVPKPSQEITPKQHVITIPSTCDDMIYRKKRNEILAMRVDSNGQPFMRSTETKNMRPPVSLPNIKKVITPSRPWWYQSPNTEKDFGETTLAIETLEEILDSLSEKTEKICKPKPLTIPINADSNESMATVLLGPSLVKPVYKSVVLVPVRSEIVETTVRNSELQPVATTRLQRI